MKNATSLDDKMSYEKSIETPIINTIRKGKENQLFLAFFSAFSEKISTIKYLIFF